MCRVLLGVGVDGMRNRGVEAGPVAANLCGFVLGCDAAWELGRPGSATNAEVAESVAALVWMAPCRLKSIDPRSSGIVVVGRWFSMELSTLGWQGDVARRVCLDDVAIGVFDALRRDERVREVLHNVDLLDDGGRLAHVVVGDGALARRASRRIGFRWRG